ncbi:trypsin-like peptidase domain-containing protein [Patescibacteria group bacterium]|nr:trypsin-like peptidase domain-containing protein [Patescibacteria group bacterium]MBU1029252.1 trypsin-like peptidase domain-containing protein [Patescibacteria group bacterium]MBU1915980.1 trypsin-like peptidase domain-containing protein [Patescibacteria group bacterium]
MSNTTTANIGPPWIFVLIMSWLIFLGSVGCDSPARPELPRLGQNWSATVMISTASGAHGTGVFVSRNGHILTNEHVANEDPDNLTVAINGSEALILDATVVATDPEHDLAIIQVKYTPRYVAVIETDDSTFYPGDGCYSVGFPHRMGKLVSVGYVRSVCFSHSGSDIPPMASDALILGQRMEPGTSGSGIFSLRYGRLVGLMSQIYWLGNHPLQLLDNPIIVPARHIRTFLEAHQIPYHRTSPPLDERLRGRIRQLFQRR